MCSNQKTYSTNSIAAALEKRGWLRSIAGDADFDAACTAIKVALDNDVGLIVSGAYGCGKSALCNIVFPWLAEHERFVLDLAKASTMVKFEPDWQDFYSVNPLACDVLIDDLGAELPENDYGVRREKVGEFITFWHGEHFDGTRLVISTNLTLPEVDARYGGRMSSRLKDLCVPLKLTGADKRQWLKPTKTPLVY